ncbi:sigma-70 family RNA polymerase sigma factor [Streptomyces sp. NBC_00249]|uniref:sigma-70 family RNA polymerase sigma factor n=1 Tax=Streptomyces sp. NBC_00249 TaxID=2975690 RepID=UPI002254ADB3|nr:sigma-70 family RNA polymerase sigma factor [Streptomyces sp. NBC_00249]MCX5198761.1 sigma-70 family RNA polymerase sigma factor [Streptomyces sp. NBC_00249]
MSGEFGEPGEPGEFEEHRDRLRAVSYRMLGSLAEAEDAVQETWLRLSRTDAGGIENLGGWLTTVVARVCLNMLRSREQRREDPVERLETRMPDPLISPARGIDPEQEVLLSDSVGLALMVVMESLSPAERLAFVLHDMFAVPFDEIAPLVEKTPAATRQLASRARRRVQGQAPAPDADLARQREAVDAFFAAARDGEFEALVAVLDPDVVLRSDGGVGGRLTMVLHGARTVASQAATFRPLVAFVRPALINGAAGVVVVPQAKAVSVMAFTVVSGKIVAIDVLSDPTRLKSLHLPPLEA